MGGVFLEPREKIERCTRTCIEDIKLDLKSRDNIPALLFGLQYLYFQETLGERLFALLDEYILPGTNKKVSVVAPAPCPGVGIVSKQDDRPLKAVTRCYNDISYLENSGIYIPIVWQSFLPQWHLIARIFTRDEKYSNCRNVSARNFSITGYLLAPDKQALPKF